MQAKLRYTALSVPLLCLCGCWDWSFPESRLTDGGGDTTTVPDLLRHEASLSPDATIDGASRDAAASDASINSLTEDFDGPVDLNTWQFVDDEATCTPKVQDGQLSIEFSSGEPAFCFLRTTNVYDFRGGDFVIHVCETLGDQSGPQTGFYLTDKDYRGDRYYWVLVEGTGFQLWANDGAGPKSFVASASLRYDQSQMSWWRLRERSGTVYFDTAPAGSGPWTERAHTPTIEPISAARLWLVGGIRRPIETPSRRACFDCVNLPTGCP